MSDCQSASQNHGTSFEQRFGLFRGTVQPVSGNRSESIEEQSMLRWIVCLQSNNCLRAGKRMFGYGQTLQRRLL